MNTSKYLPIGTVVLLKNATKKVMITGFAVTGKETGDKMYDYSGCLYPEGIVRSDQNLLFDHNQIYQIYYFGYISDEEKEFKNKFNQLMAKQTENETNPINNQQPSQQNVPHQTENLSNQYFS